MTAQDFSSLKYFSYKSIQHIPNENIPLIKVELFRKVDTFRDIVQNRMNIICVTSGKHETGSVHYLGQALDFVFMDVPEPSIQKIIQTAAIVGLSGLGFYWNGQAMSYHLDIGHNLFTLWRGWKAQVDANIPWVYLPLLADITKSCVL